jgi:hypothetical protein
MKRLIAAALLTCGLAMPASAANDFVLWQGNMFLTAANAACNGGGWSVGNFFNAVLRPRGLGDNGTFTGFALYSTRNAQRYAVQNKGFVTGFYTGVTIYSSAGFAGWDGTGGTLHSKLTVQVSPTVTAAHKTLTATVTITNFGNVENCTATVVGALYQRP